MPTWKLAATVFVGGTQQVNSMQGYRVKVKFPMLSVPLYDPIHNKQQTIELRGGSVGFVANPHADNILIAFPTLPGTVVGSLGALRRSGAFQVAVINYPTFKAQFEVEYP